MNRNYYIRLKLMDVQYDSTEKTQEGREEEVWNEMDMILENEVIERELWKTMKVRGFSFVDNVGISLTSVEEE